MNGNNPLLQFFKIMLDMIKCIRYDIIDGNIYIENEEKLYRVEFVEIQGKDLDTIKEENHER